MTTPALSLPQPVAFVFTGGLARAAAQVGMVRACLEHGLTPDLIVGSSTGALNAAVCALDIENAHETLHRTWTNLGNDPKLVTMWRSAMRGIAGSQAKRTGAILRKHIEGAIDPTAVWNKAVPCHINATDLDTGLAVDVSYATPLDAVLTSMSLPVILPPVPSGKTYFLDGGISANVPISQACDAGAKSIVLLDTGASSVPETDVEDLGWYEVMALAYSHMLRGQAGHDIARAAAKVPILAMSYGSNNPFEFKSSNLHIESGEKVATSVLSTQRISRKPGIYGQLVGLESDERLTHLYR